MRAQRPSETSIGSLIDFGEAQAIRVHHDSSLYHQLVRVWTEMWTSSSHNNNKKGPVASSPGNGVFYAPQCVTMTRDRFDNLRKSVLEQHKTWYASWKSNGDRYALMITSLKYSSERMCVMVNRRMDMFLVEISCPLTYYDGTVVTGDLIACQPQQQQKGKTSFYFELDDVHCWRGIRVAEHCKRQRIEFAQSIVKVLSSQHPSPTELAFRIIAKPWVPIQHLPALIKAGHLQYLLEKNSGVMVDDMTDDEMGEASFQMISHANWRTFWLGLVCPDGLIFQENDAPLGIMTVESIIKAKPKAARTRDWLTLLHKEDNNRLDLYSFIGKNLPNLVDIDVKQVMFQRNMWWRKVKSQTHIESLSSFAPDSSDGIREALQISTLKCQADELHQCIVEWAPDFARGAWHPIKKRDADKLYANHDSVLTAEEEDFLKGPVTIDELVDAFGLAATTMAPRQSAAPHFTALVDMMDDLRSSVKSNNKLNVLGLPLNALNAHSDVNRVMNEQWQQRNAVKRILPSFMHLNFQQPAFPTLTKYERPQVISMEAQRLANGGDALVPIGESSSVIEIAERTLLAGTLPCWVKRPFPNEKVYAVQACRLDVQWKLCNNRNAQYN